MCVDTSRHQDCWIIPDHHKIQRPTNTKPSNPPLSPLYFFSFLWRFWLPFRSVLPFRLTPQTDRQTERKRGRQACKQADKIGRMREKQREASPTEVGYDVSARQWRHYPAANDCIATFQDGWLKVDFRLASDERVSDISDSCRSASHLSHLSLSLPL